MNSRRFLLFLALAAGSRAVLPGHTDSGPAPARPHILGISQVGLWVKDLEQSRAFYKDYLGFAEPFSLQDREGRRRLTWIKLNDRQTLELFPLSDTAPPHGDSLHHIAFETNDAQGLLTYLIAHGVKGPGAQALAPVVQADPIGNLGYWVEDPDGHVIELVQSLPSGWTAQHRGQSLPATRIAGRMSHAGIAVAHLDACLRFYRDLLGFQEFWRGSADGKVLNWVNLRVPDGPDYLEVMLYGNKPDFERLHSLNHVCLEVPDLKPVVALLGSRTLPPTCRPTQAMKVGVNGKRQINCFDPDGTRVEVMEAATADGRPVAPSRAPPPVPVSKI